MIKISPLEFIAQTFSYLKGVSLKDEKKMVCYFTRPQQEIKTSQELSSMGITNYCPTITIIKQYSDRKKKVIKPLLSFLCHGSSRRKSRRNLVFSCTGIVGYLFFLGKPAVVAAFEIHLMQDHLNGVYVDFNLATLRIGEYPHNY